MTPRPAPGFIRNVALSGHRRAGIICDHCFRRCYREGGEWLHTDDGLASCGDFALDHAEHVATPRGLPSA